MAGRGWPRRCGVPCEARPNLGQQGSCFRLLRAVRPLQHGPECRERDANAEHPAAATKAGSAGFAWRASRAAPAVYLAANFPLEIVLASYESVGYRKLW